MARWVVMGLVLLVLSVLLFARLGHYALWDDEAMTVPTNASNAANLTNATNAINHTNRHGRACPGHPRRLSLAANAK